MELLQRVVLGDVMSIVRVTVRTFQNAEHATLFLGLSNGIEGFLKERGIKADCRIARSQEKAHEIISVWIYDDEAHMDEVRKVLSEFSKFPNSLNPKEVAYQADVVTTIREGVTG
jgi:hypothetical protein